MKLLHKLVLMYRHMLSPRRIQTFGTFDEWFKVRYCCLDVRNAINRSQMFVDLIRTSMLRVNFELKLHQLVLKITCLDLGDSLPESKRRLLTLSLPPLTRRLVFEKQKVFLRNIWMVSTISVVSGESLNLHNKPTRFCCI